MQIDVEDKQLSVVLNEAKFDVALTTDAPLDVNVGESAKIDVGQAVDYIKSGEAEIEQAVDSGLDEFNANAVAKTNAFNANAVAKTNTFNQNATDKTSDFNTNASDKTTAFNNNASSKTTDFNDNYTAKLGDFNDNAVDKTNDFNSNASDKTGDFNDNATSKTNDFNDNYALKKQVIDDAVSDAQGYATSASNSAGLAKQWAIGDPSEPTGNSAKYWAEQASSALSGLSSRVSTIEGEIPAEASASNQLADKAYVSSVLPTVNNATLTIQKNGTDVQTFTANASTNVTANITVPTQASDIGAQDALVSGTNIKTINNNSILGSGNLDINGLPSQTGQSGKFLTTDGTDASWANVDALPSQTGQSGKYLTTDGSSASWATVSTTPSIDNKSITTNGSSQLQTIGVIDQNNTSTAIKTWTGTKAQYDAIVTKDSNTLYNVTDDTDVSLTILEALYPVGSIYETTEATCPLATLISGSTWVQETSRILVDKYVSGTDWWNLYSDGWCEQGGISSATTGTITINLLKAYKDTNYTISETSSTGGKAFSESALNLRTVSSFTAQYNSISGSSNANCIWRACGYTSTTTNHKRFRRTA